MRETVPTAAESSINYKNTLNLPKTDFPMRGNLPKREPETIRRWQEIDLYGKLQAAREQAKGAFLLHDGPPYANGNIHLGHTLNKILKDIIVKFRVMAGARAPYVPGWDCHGLPIELAMEKTLGRKSDVSKVEFRKLCREYASRYVGIQREEFRRLGIIGDWQNPYLTMDARYEAIEVREFGKLLESGAIYRGRKPVLWCASCATALAEAEVEYEDISSASIYVAFALVPPLPLPLAAVRRPQPRDRDLDDDAMDAAGEPRDRGPSRPRVRGRRRGIAVRWLSRTGCSSRSSRPSARSVRGSSPSFPAPRSRTRGPAIRGSIVNRRSFSVTTLRSKRERVAFIPRLDTVRKTTRSGCAMGSTSMRPWMPRAVSLPTSRSIAGERVFDADAGHRRASAGVGATRSRPSSSCTATRIAGGARIP